MDRHGSASLRSGSPTNSSQSDTLKVKSPILSLPTIVVGIFVGIYILLLNPIFFISMKVPLVYNGKLLGMRKSNQNIKVKSQMGNLMDLVFKLTKMETSILGDTKMDYQTVKGDPFTLMEVCI